MAMYLNILCAILCVNIVCCKFPTIAQSHNALLPKCSSSSRMLPDPTDCQRFFRCLDGKPVRFSCPPRTMFDPKSQVCTWGVGENGCGGNSNIQNLQPRTFNNGFTISAAMKTSPYRTVVKSEGERRGNEQNENNRNKGSQTSLQSNDIRETVTAYDYKDSDEGKSGDLASTSLEYFRNTPKTIQTTRQTTRISITDRNPIPQHISDSSSRPLKPIKIENKEGHELGSRKFSGTENLPKHASSQVTSENSDNDFSTHEKNAITKSVSDIKYVTKKPTQQTIPQETLSDIVIPTEKSSNVLEDDSEYNSQENDVTYSFLTNEDDSKVNSDKENTENLHQAPHRNYEQTSATTETQIAENGKDKLNFTGSLNHTDATILTYQPANIIAEPKQAEIVDFNMTSDNNATLSSNLFTANETFTPSAKQSKGEKMDIEKNVKIDTYNSRISPQDKDAFRLRQSISQKSLRSDRTRTSREIEKAKKIPDYTNIDILNEKVGQIRFLDFLKHGFGNRIQPTPVTSFWYTRQTNSINKQWNRRITKRSGRMGAKNQPAKYATLRQEQTIPPRTVASPTEDAHVSKQDESVSTIHANPEVVTNAKNFVTPLSALDEGYSGVENVQISSYMARARRFRCPKPSGHFRDPINCSVFYHCDRGIPYRRDCPEFEVFHQEVESCVASHLVPPCQHSNDDAFVCPTPNGLYKDPQSCMHYFECSMGFPMRQKCMEGAVFDTERSKCSYSAIIPGCKHDAEEDINNDNNVATAASHGSYSCPKDGYFRDPSSCQAFYLCANGKAIRKLCNKGTSFDTDLNMCVWSILVRGCEDYDDSANETAVEEKEIVEEQHAFLSGANGESTQKNNGIVVEEREFEQYDFMCPNQDGVFPDDKDCNVYYVCARDSALRMRCPVGLGYDVTTGFCIDVMSIPRCVKEAYDLAMVENRQQPPSSFVCPEDHGLYSDPNNCSVFIHCFQGKPYRHECQEGTLYNQETASCTWPHLAGDCNLQHRQHNNSKINTKENVDDDRINSLAKKMVKGKKKHRYQAGNPGNTDSHYTTKDEGNNKYKSDENRAYIQKKYGKSNGENNHEENFINYGSSSAPVYYDNYNNNDKYTGLDNENKDTNDNDDNHGYIIENYSDNTEKLAQDHDIDQLDNNYDDNENINIDNSDFIVESYETNDDVTRPHNNYVNRNINLGNNGDDNHGYIVQNYNYNNNNIQLKNNDNINNNNNNNINNNINNNSPREISVEIQDFRCPPFVDGYYRDYYFCDIFHRCAFGTKFTFFCPSGTFFRLELNICDFWETVDDCSEGGLRLEALELLPQNTSPLKSSLQLHRETAQPLHFNSGTSSFNTGTYRKTDTFTSLNPETEMINQWGTSTSQKPQTIRQADTSPDAFRKQNRGPVSSDNAEAILHDSKDNNKSSQAEPVEMNDQHKKSASHQQTDHLSNVSPGPQHSLPHPDYEEDTANAIYSYYDTNNIDDSVPCPASNGLFAHPRNCHQFIFCAQNMPLVLTCPDSLVYNPQTLTCDFPDNVMCIRYDKVV